MRICITSKGPSLSDQFDERFGRCPYLLLVDQDSEEVTAMKNPGVLAEHGAGIAAARRVSESGVDVLITGRLGPNAEELLVEAKLKAYRATAGTGKAVLDAFTTGQLKQLLPGVASSDQ